ncbi:MAG: VOC family protein [Clostridia bacterium]|nr:VOC family protein [Clostridia bacterium]
MSFCWATVYVRDLEESLRFYQDIVGLTVDRRFPAGPGMEIVFLGDGETKLELIANQEIKEVSIGPHISLGFKVDSLDEQLAFVKDKGIPIQSGPFQPNPNTRFFFIRDPNGLTIQFVEIK